MIFHYTRLVFGLDEFSDSSYRDVIGQKAHSHENVETGSLVSMRLKSHLVLVAPGGEQLRPSTPSARPSSGRHSRIGGRFALAPGRPGPVRPGIRWHAMEVLRLPRYSEEQRNLRDALALLFYFVFCLLICIFCLLESLFSVFSSRFTVCTIDVEVHKLYYPDRFCICLVIHRSPY